MKNNDLVKWRKDTEPFEWLFQKNLSRVPGYSDTLKGYFENPSDYGELQVDNNFHYFMLEEHYNVNKFYPVSIIIFEGYLYAMSGYNEIKTDYVIPIHEITMKIGFFEDSINFIHKGKNIIRSLDSKLILSLKSEGHTFRLIKKHIEISISLFNNPQQALTQLEQKKYPPDYLVNLLDSETKESIMNSISKNIENRDISLTTANIFNPQEVERLSMIFFEEHLNQYGFNDYSIVDITRSTFNQVENGTYVYEITNDKTIRMIKIPLKVIVNRSGDSFNVFDKRAYDESVGSLVEIKFSEIKDFQFFGSELMINRVETEKTKELYGTINSPRIIGTAFREFLFGSSYSTLKGMSSMMNQLNQTIKANKVNISTISEIKDTRVVQLILQNKSDIEFKGISVYYEFNRKMGNVKNKETNETSNHKSSEDNFDNKDNVVELLKEYKKMLDDGLIDTDEYKSLKKKALKID